MLTLWLTVGGDAVAPSRPGLEIKAAGSALRRIDGIGDASLTGAETVLIGAGLALATGVLETAKASGVPLLVTINGLGDAALTDVLVRGGVHVVPLFDAGGIATTDLAEQLAWLRGRGRPFAVTVTDPDQAALSILAGAAILVVQGRAADIVHVASRLVSVSRIQAPRPQSTEEIDALDGREACLTVTTPLSVGDVVQAGHLTVAITASRGLSPRLAPRVVGARLAYAIAPGEPLHFAHLGDPKA